MHRLLTNTQGYKHVVDHINHDTLDNRKVNLRITNIENNSKHREKKNRNNKSGYRNVFWNKNVDQWQVSLHKNHKSIFIGYFNDVNIAGKAAEDARQKYYGEFAGGS